ncbi:MAG: NAAT family transporter [Archaeoglobaceae archaeon]|nr:NAAT family transporter [Archaeoglobaceae archaeon]MCX8151938.1 NAAT family transporter [Archaeoglobaceae archaeon]MDW8013327.1 NAAT family transporter [Archaeoglobaceae archaeon]
MDYLTFFVTCFTTFFVIVDPPGNLPIFVALTEKFSKEVREKISKRSTVVALVLLLSVTITGGAILDFFRISIDSLRIAGGILLFIVAMDIVFGGTRKEAYKRRAEKSIDIDSVAIFPLALPLYTGPGAITAGIVLYSQALDVFSKILVVVAAVIVFFLVRLSHVYSDAIIKLLGESGADIVARILAIFLTALAVEFVFEGLKGKINEL